MNRDTTKIERQIAELTKTIQSETDSKVLTQALILRAHGYSIVGQRKESVEDYLRALDLSVVPSEICHIKSMISLAFLEGGNNEQAMWWSVAAIECDPTSPEGHFTFGLNCSASDLHKCAIIAFQTTLASDSGHSQARLQLGKSLREEGDLDGSLRELKTFVTDNSGDPRGHYELAWTIHINPQLDDRVSAALRHYHAALKLNPEKSLRERIERNVDSLTSG